MKKQHTQIRIAETSEEVMKVILQYLSPEQRKDALLKAAIAEKKQQDKQWQEVIDDLAGNKKRG